VELYQLKTFVKVADTGNLTRAAEALFTSQPAISAQIKALEDELKVQLFDRTPKGMLLTGAGKVLYTHANTTLSAADKVKQEALKLQNELVGELKVGIHTDFGFMRTGKVYGAFQQKHPQVTLHFLQTSSSKIARQLRTGELDAGFMFGPCDASDAKVTLIKEIPMNVVAPANQAHDFTHCSLEDLLEKPWIYTSPSCPFYHLCEALFAEIQSRPTRMAWVDTEEAVRELVRAGVGLSILRTDDAITLEQQGEASIWEGFVPDMSLHFVCSKKRINEPTIKAFLETVEQQWEDGAPNATLTANG